MIRTFISIMIVTAVMSAAYSTTAQASPTAPFAKQLGIEVRYALDVNKFESSTTPTKFVYVRCYVSDKAFDGAVAWRFGADGSDIWAYAMRKEHTVYMRGWTCNQAKLAISKLKHGNSNLTKGEIFGYSTLLHESIHVQGVKNENTTECLANDGVRWAAMNLYDISKSEANRLSRLAFDLSARLTTDEYHSISGDCQRKLANHDWTDYIVPA